jgi:hypothetical protein
MIKKIVLIGGSVLLVGGLAFLYFKNKKKTDDLLSGGAIPSGGATASTTGVATSPVNNQISPLSSGGIVASGTSTSFLNEENLPKAQDIVKKIKAYEKTKLLTTTSKNKVIEKYKKELLKLGYKYDNNLLSKI